MATKKDWKYTYTPEKPIPEYIPTPKPRTIPEPPDTPYVPTFTTRPVGVLEGVAKQAANLLRFPGEKVPGQYAAPVVDWARNNVISPLQNFGKAVTNLPAAGATAYGLANAANNYWQSAQALMPPAIPQQYPQVSAPQNMSSVPWPPTGFPQVGLGAKVPQPLNMQTQVPPAGPQMQSKAAGGGKQPPPIANAGTIGVGGLPDRKVPDRYSVPLRMQGTVASPALDQNPALEFRDQFGPLSSAPAAERAFAPAIQPGMPPQVGPELTAGSQAAAELDAPKTWLQKMATPQGRDFIAMIGQMLAAKGSTYGNEPPASLGYATAARGVTQQALANDWSTRLAADPNAKPPSTLSQESQKQVMDIHEHKAQNEQRKFERQYKLQELDMQKQRLAMQAELEKLETAYKEKELTLREKVANGTLAQQELERSLIPGQQAIQNKRLEIMDIEANTANLQARIAQQGGGMTAGQQQSARYHKMNTVNKWIEEGTYLDEATASAAYDRQYSGQYETPSVLPPQQGAPTANASAGLSEVQKLLSLYPNDPQLKQAFELLKSGKIKSIPIKAGGVYYNALFGGK